MEPTEKSHLFVIPLQPESHDSNPPSEPPPEPPCSDEPTKYTLEQAFNYLYDPNDGQGFEAVNRERSIRAVAFLLHYCSEMGNDPVKGWAAHGLGCVLEDIASRLDIRD